MECVVHKKGAKLVTKSRMTYCDVFVRFWVECKDTFQFVREKGMIYLANYPIADIHAMADGSKVPDEFLYGLFSSSGWIRFYWRGQYFAYRNKCNHLVQPIMVLRFRAFLEMIAIYSVKRIFPLHLYCAPDILKTAYNVNRDLYKVITAGGRMIDPELCYFNREAYHLEVQRQISQYLLALRDFQVTMAARVNRTARSAIYEPRVLRLIFAFLLGM